MSQVEPTAASLNTNDVFVLKTEESVYVWKGKGKTDEEMTTAKLLVNKLWGGATIVELEETQEPCEPLRNSLFLMSVGRLCQKSLTHNCVCLPFS